MALYVIHTWAGKSLCVVANHGQIVITAQCLFDVKKRHHVIQVDLSHCLQSSGDFLIAINFTLINIQHVQSSERGHSTDGDISHAWFKNVFQWDYSGWPRHSSNLVYRTNKGELNRKLSAYHSFLFQTPLCSVNVHKIIRSTLALCYGNSLPAVSSSILNPSIVTCEKPLCSEVVILTSVQKDPLTSPWETSLFLVSMTRAPSATSSLSGTSFLPPLSGLTCRVILPLCGSSASMLVTWQLSRANVAELCKWTCLFVAKMCRTSVGQSSGFSYSLWQHVSVCFRQRLWLFFHTDPVQHLCRNATSSFWRVISVSVIISKCLHRSISNGSCTQRRFGLTHWW